MKIEKHIKAMKNKKYIQNMKLCPEIIERLLKGGTHINCAAYFFIIYPPCFQ